ncbi:4Fe-4S binding protein [Methanospirillum sp. J.3.6.1-F.2.7.3]|uniref:4Fe-4S binding protein n=1 Tax=Methanospirillum purgamenti TaxID=2834276 RepID=A0A8E7B2G8_9EURY|nr:MULTISPECIES: 4Fe-4S binding protein [Methanospirillum]MDX8551446.1 4Fe-4S binding protein [Methanospirillum hungatei]QVV89903.1 4Fe-4S binding protein [Methanospirillum sp. J.3.6.1-F.2.7.3]
MSTLFPKYSKTSDGSKVIMEQRLLQQVNNLILDNDVCTGCGICAEVCPEEAIVVGAVGGVRRGLVDDAASIRVDETKCSYCGVCVIMCPFSALALKVDGEERLPILEKEGFPTYDKGTAIDQDKCVRCNICDDVCPRDAIDRDVPLFEGQDKEGLAKGQGINLKVEFVVDDEKCTKCGICGNLCEAINVLHKPFSPEKGAVEGEVIWDEAYCDGCNVCAEACPSEAIKVTRTVVGQKKLGNVNIIEEDCCTCRWCAINCPTEAITVNKIFEGEITFHAEKCPGGCSTCVDVCPANAIYLPTPKPAKDMKGQVEANIAVNPDFCILCGACVHACPGEDIIYLRRDSVKIKGKETDLFKKIKEKLFTPRTSKVKEQSSLAGSVELKAVSQ